MKCISARKFVASLAAALPLVLYAADPPPVLTNVTVLGTQMAVDFDPYPSAQGYTFFSATNLHLPFLPDTNFFWVPYNLATNYVTNGADRHHKRQRAISMAQLQCAAAFFVRLQATPMSSNALLTAIVLNRLAYGPTPDELERV